MRFLVPFALAAVAALAGVGLQSPVSDARNVEIARRPPSLDRPSDPRLAARSPALKRPSDPRLGGEIAWELS